MKTRDGMTQLALPLLELALRAGRAILTVYESDDFETEHKADKSPLTLADRRSHETIEAGLERLTPEIPILSEEGRDIPYEERSHWQELWVVDPLDGTKEFIKRNGEFTVNIALVQDSQPVMGVIYAPVRGETWLGITGAGAWKLSDAEVARLQADASTAPAARLAAAANPVSVRLPHESRVSIIASRTHMNPETKAFIDEAGAGFADVEILNVGSSLKLCYVAEGRADLYPRYAPTSEWDTAAGHAIVRAAGGEIYQAGPDADVGNTPFPLRYNKENLLNPWFVARAW